MPVHRLTRVLPYAPDQLFHLVGDVDHYPDFVPWITGMRTWNHRCDDTGASLVDAEAAVGFSLLQERFTTRVRRDPLNRVVEVELIRGPFRRLTNRWTFHPHERGTEIEFFIDFEFKSRILQAVLEANFNRAVDKLIACFEARAGRLYSPVLHRDVGEGDHEVVEGAAPHEPEPSPPPPSAR